MDRGDGHHNDMYGAAYLHLPLNLPFLAAEDLEPSGDGLMERTGGPTVLQNATPNEPSQGQGQEGAPQPGAQNEDRIQPAMLLLLPREPAAQPDDFFLLYDYETEDSDQEESDLEDSDSEEDDGENLENDMDTMLHETLSEVSL